MNTFTFIGNIPKPLEKTNIIKTTSTGKKYLKLSIKQNENNSAYVYMYGDKLINGSIPVFIDGNREFINYEDRFDESLLSKISYLSKYRIYTEHEGIREFIWKDDFIEYVYDLLIEMPSNTVYEVRGEFSVSYSNNKFYNNFNIRSIRISNSEKPCLKMYLDLFYKYNSLDESDKKNKFVINSYIEQYSYTNKRREYFPLQTQFITNRFNFKDPSDIEIIKHRKANLQPFPEEGYVKARWEAQYVKGAQLILPPLETLPKDIQFEIKNAGREIKEYMCNVVGEASEFICLTRPDNTKSKDGKVYESLGVSNEEFEEKINYNYKQNKNNSIDNIAKKEAIENPFN